MGMATGGQIAVRRHDDLAGRIKGGAVGGLIAGAVFAMFEMVIAAVQNGGAAFFMPLRMIGAMVLGAEALEPSYELATAAPVGALVHMALSVIFGILFGLALSAIPALGRAAGGLVVAGAVYGLLLWLANFYAIAPPAGWDWFPEGTDKLVQFLAHTVFFGAVLGLYLNRVERRPGEAPR